MNRVTRLLVFCLTLIAPMAVAADLVKKAEVDLNADGKKEKIALSQVDPSGGFTLEIGKKSVDGKLNDEVDGFMITDIETGDSFVEIAVHTPGPSDDDEYLVYSYDGKVITEMGRLARWPKFTGNGIVYVADWMGFWERTEKYVLDTKARVLKRVPQEFYYVGKEATVARSCPIHEKKGSRNVVANLRKNSRISILLYAPKDDESGWYLFKSSTGLVGWKDSQSLSSDLSDLPWAD